MFTVHIWLKVPFHMMAIIYFLPEYKPKCFEIGDKLFGLWS